MMSLLIHCKNQISDILHEKIYLCSDDNVDQMTIINLAAYCTAIVTSLAHDEKSNYNRRFDGNVGKKIKL